MPTYTATKLPNGNYEVYKDGNRITTGSVSVLQNYGLSETKLSNTGTPPTGIGATTSNPTPQPAPTVSVATAKSPIPDSTYVQLRQQVVNGTMTPDNAIATLQGLLNEGLYSGSVSTGKLFPTGQTFTKPDGTKVQFDNSGTGRTIVTDRPTQQTTVTPEGITTTNVFNQKVENKSFQSSSAYKALSAEDRAFVDQAFSLISFGTEEDAKIFANAVQKAQELAAPYYKSKIALAKASLGVELAKTSNDYEAAKELIERTQKELLEDVSSNKEFLSVEFQSELARTSRDLNYDLQEIADVAAEKGITFATGARSRVEAERRREEQYTDVVQSSTREYNFKIAEIEKAAERGEAAAQAQLDKINKAKGVDLRGIGLNAEQILGTSNLPAVEGYTPVGGVLGNIQEEKERNLISDVKGGVELQRDLLPS